MSAYIYIPRLCTNETILGGIVGASLFYLVRRLKIFQEITCRFP